MRPAAIAIALLATGCGKNEESAQVPVTLFAAASLREAVTEIAQEWTKRTGRPHRLQFEASSTLARQIKEGAPADLFISADKDWMDQVAVLERRDWVGNTLVCVVPKETKEFDFKTVRRLALAGGQVPAGRYARAALAYLKIETPGAPITGNNVRDVLSKVSQGGADAGIVYATDAATDPGVRVAFTFPRESHPAIVYPAGLINERGRDLFQALSESWAIEVAKRKGFEVLP